MATAWRVKGGSAYCIDTSTGEIHYTKGWRTKPSSFACQIDGVLSSVFENVLDNQLVDKSFTMCYYPSDKAWRGYHDWKPDYIFANYSKVMSVKDSILYLHNKGPRGRFYNGVYYPSFVDAVFADNTEQYKFLQAVKWKAEITDNGILEYDTPIDFITVRTNVHASGKIGLTNLVNTRQTKGYWHFNKFRDIVKRNADSSFTQFLKDVFNDFEIDVTQLDSTVPLFVQRRFISSYFVVRFECNNYNDRNFVLIDVNINYLDQPR